MIAHKNIKYICARLSNSDRLLFTKTQHNGIEAFVMLTVITNHRYDRVNFHQLNKITDFANRKIEVKKNLENSKESNHFLKIENLKNGYWLGKLVTFDPDQEAILESSDMLPLFLSGHCRE